MNILVVHRARDGFHEERSEWGGYRFWFADFCLHYLFQVSQDGRITGILQKTQLEKVVEEIASSDYDAIWCGCPEAFLLQYVLKKQKITMPPFIIVDLNRLRKAKEVCAWIHQVYGENPYTEILSRPTNYWICYTESEVEEHIQLGVCRDRIFFVPCSLYFQDETMIPRKGLSRHVMEKASDDPMKDQVIACGNNNRDYETLLEAAKELPFRIHIFSSAFFRKRPTHIPSNVVIHDDVSLERLYHILRAALFVVIPLKTTFYSPGTASTALAIGFGKAVVATDLPCLRDYVLHEKSGLLLPPGDPSSLRQAIMELYLDRGKLIRFGEEAKKLSDRLDALAKKNLSLVFKLATSSSRMALA